jgi:hypothetical protein
MQGWQSAPGIPCSTMPLEFPDMPLYGEYILDLIWHVMHQD